MAIETPRNPLIPLILPSHLDPDLPGTQSSHQRLKLLMSFPKEIPGIRYCTPRKSITLLTGCPLTAGEMPAQGYLICVVKGSGARRKREREKSPRYFLSRDVVLTEFLLLLISSPLSHVSLGSIPYIPIVQ